MINHIGRKSHLSIHPLVRHIDPPQCPKHFPNLSQHHSEFFHVVDSVGGEGIEGEHGHGLCIYGIWHVEEVGGGRGGKGCIVFELLLLSSFIIVYELAPRAGFSQPSPHLRVFSFIESEIPPFGGVQPRL
jgi:hypothetical protein